jgi:hypothetical protein
MTEIDAEGREARTSRQSAWKKDSVERAVRMVV